MQLVTIFLHSLFTLVNHSVTPEFTSSTRPFMVIQAVAGWTRNCLFFTWNISMSLSPNTVSPNLVYNILCLNISSIYTVMLLVDGHSTHMSLAAAQYCFTNDIILYCLLENATHILQPCDVGFFSPMKAAWKKEVKAWQLANIGQALTK